MVATDVERKRAEYRKQKRQMRRSMSAAAQGEASRAVCARALTHVDDREAKRIAVYRAIDGEIGTVELIAELRKRPGVSLFLPIVAAEHRLMMVPLDSNVDSLACVPIEKLDLIFVPIVVFDRAGNRLGMGAGCYDRFLARWQDTKCHVIGLAHDNQIVDQVPTCSWDVPLPIILTPSECIFATHKSVESPSFSIDTSTCGPIEFPIDPSDSALSKRFEAINNAVLDTFRECGRFGKTPRPEGKVVDRQFNDDGNFSFGRMFDKPPRMSRDEPVQGAEVMRIDSTGFVELLRGETTVGFAAVAIGSNGSPKVNSLFLLPTSQERESGRELFHQAVAWLKTELPGDSPINVAESNLCGLEAA